MTPRLVLFDIDGTLLSAGRVFREALAEALIAIFGTTGPMESYEFSGRSDPEIVRGLMRGAGFEDAAIDAHLGQVLERFANGLVPLLVAETIRAKPGIPELVERLAGDDGVTLGLLTGNLERCAHAKLEPLGLNAHFALGAFGSDHEDRRALPAIAVERAFRATGRRFAGKSVVIVGDSIYDVRCGQGLGVRAVAVASGTTSRDRLRAECPDALLDDFSDVEAAIATILGNGAE
jgi:phosphoglycolate phosphatase